MEKRATIYCAPLIEVNEVATESGFAICGHAPDSDDSEFGSPDSNG